MQKKAVLKFKISLLGAIFFLSTFWLEGFSIMESKFPSASYVLKSFNVPYTYLNSPSFVSFVLNNEQRYRSFYRNSLKRGERYIPLFKELFSKGGISPLFMYMSMTESGFKPSAKSSKKAVGLWQFMSATARRFNLRVDNQRDDRYDPVASTKAAMKYLQTLYKMFGKWYLVMMAYNCGEGRLQRAIKRAGTDDFIVLMDDKKKYIPLETRNYLKKIILFSMMGSKIQHSSNKIDKAVKKNILPNSEVLVNFYGHITIKEIVDILRMSPEKLLKLNPMLAKNGIRDDLGIIQIFIPRNRVRFYNSYYHPPLLRDLYKERGYSHLLAHIVERGETLDSIARAYQSTPLDIVIATELKSPLLKSGEVVMVPVTEKFFNEHSLY